MLGIVALLGAAGIFYAVAHWIEEKIDKSVERKLTERSAYWP
jgi:hypothetical protein